MRNERVMFFRCLDNESVAMGRGGVKSAQNSLLAVSCDDTEHGESRLELEGV